MYPRENNFIVHCVVRRPGCTLDVAPSLTPLERCRAQRSVTSSSPSQAVSLTPGPALHSRGSVCSRSDRVLPSPTGPRGDPHSSLGRCHKLMLWRCRVRPSVPGQGRRPLRSLEANLSSRFRPSPPGPRRHPPCPLETNLSSHFRPSQPGPRRRPQRPHGTKPSPRFRPTQPGRRGADCTPLKRTCCLDFPVADIVGGRRLLSVISAQEVDTLGVPSALTSTLAPFFPVAASTTSSFDVEQTSAVCPRPLCRLHSFSVQLGLIRPFLPRLSHPLARALRSVVLALRPSRSATSAEPPPTALVPLSPYPCFFSCRGLHLSRGHDLHLRRRTEHAQSSIPFSLFPENR